MMNKADVLAYADEIFSKRIGGARIVVEEKLVGEEFTTKLDENRVALANLERPLRCDRKERPLGIEMACGELLGTTVGRAN